MNSIGVRQEVGDLERDLGLLLRQPAGPERDRQQQHFEAEIVKRKEKIARLQAEARSQSNAWQAKAQLVHALISSSRMLASAR